MIQDGRLVCDVCHKPITRITDVPPEGWPQLRSLCSACFGDLRKRAVPR